MADNPKSDITYIITGPTASGKTARAVALAREIGAEIVSADSRQVYRGMDIGTGKDLDEYRGVPYHLIDICPAGYSYSLFEFLRDCRAALDDIARRGRRAVICGGTGLYIESVAKGIQLPPVPANPGLREKLAGKTLAELSSILSGYKTLHNTTDTDTAQRAIRAIEIQEYYRTHPDAAALTTPKPMRNIEVIGVDIDRESRRQRITKRLRERLSQGMADEVRKLLESGVSQERLIAYGLEYKYVTLYVTGKMSLDQMLTQLETAIHQFAKRQMTWFRGMERRGLHIRWLDWRLSPQEFTAAILNP